MANGVMTVDIVDYTQPIMFEDGAPCEVDFLGNRYVKVKFAKNSDMYVGLPDTGYIGTRYWYDKHGRFLGQGSSKNFKRIVNAPASTECEDWS